MESAYEACLENELRTRGLVVERQKTLPVRYKEVLVDAGYRLDLFVEGEAIVEVKSVREIAPIHRAQRLTYLELSGRHLGLLLNSNVKRLEDGGIHRLVQGEPRSP
jgi:GxxExxY protein